MIHWAGKLRVSIAAVLLTAGCTVGAAATDNPGLVLTANTTATQVAVGVAVHVTAKLTNKSDSPFVIEVRSQNFALEITHDGVTKRLEIPRFTTSRAEIFDRIPLIPQSAYELPLPVPLNDATGLPGTVWMAKPGTYTLRAVFESAGPSVVADALFWRGTARSAPMTVTVSDPSAAEVKQWRERLRQCVATNDCETIAIANYYRIVRDHDAAENLMRLLERSPLSIWLLDAIVNQRRAGDGRRLLQLAQTIPDAAIKKRYVGAASGL